jgi:uncharacterized protein DUF5335
METRESPRNEWRSFFEIFSRQHDGWLATLEIFAQEGDAQQAPREVPLKGITLTSVVGESEAIALKLGKTPEDHVKHTVIEPTHVWLTQTPEGANAALKLIRRTRQKQCFDSDPHCCLSSWTESF